MINPLVLANSNLTDASKKVRTIHNSVSKLQGSMRNKSFEMYYRLSLLAGGVLSLSITYIGYLASTPKQEMVYSELLFFGWFSLLLTVISGIYRNHFNLDMGHYQTVNVLNNARLEEFKATLTMLELNPQQFANLNGPDDVAKQIEVTKKNISTVEKAIKEVSSLEKRNSKLWVINQNIAHISFILGLTLITIFAGLNLPIEAKFNLIERLKGQ